MKNECGDLLARQISFSRLMIFGKRTNQRSTRVKIIVIKKTELLNRMFKMQNCSHLTIQQNNEHINKQIRCIKVRCMPNNLRQIKQIEESREKKSPIIFIKLLNHFLTLIWQYNQCERKKKK